MSSALLAAFGAERGIVCLVGAGGKKTTMYALAAAHPGRVLLSSTSHMYPYDAAQVDCIVRLERPDAPMPDVHEHRVVAVATEIGTRNRVGAVAPARIETLFAAGDFDLCLLKADGARARWIKAPGEHEPVIPGFATTVVPVVSARVIGRPLDDRIAHRPERLAALFGIRIGEPIEAEHLVTLLSDSAGALKGVGSAEVVPLINMVDDEHSRRLARTIAEAAMARSGRISRVVTASMKHARLADVVER